MNSYSETEILGDYSNFKGTEYHFVFLLWFISRQPHARLAFFQGNDLLAVPTPPPVSSDGPVQAVVVKDESDEQPPTDLWIQVKNTDAPWTVTQLLGNNLLHNFILNTFSSQAGKRAWKVSLVTPGRLRSDQILAFADEIDSRRKQRGTNALRLKAIARRAYADIHAAANGLRPTQAEARCGQCQ